MLAALQSLNTGGAKISAKEVAEIGDKTLPRPKSAGAKVNSPPKSAGKNSKRVSGFSTSPTAPASGNVDREKKMSSSASAPLLPPLHGATVRQQMPNNANYGHNHNPPGAHNTYNTSIEEEAGGDEDEEEEEEEGEEDEEDEEEGEGNEYEEDGVGAEGGDGHYENSGNYASNYDTNNGLYQHEQLQQQQQYDHYRSPQQNPSQQYQTEEQHQPFAQAHYAHGGAGYHQPAAYYDQNYLNGPGQEHQYPQQHAVYDESAYAQSNDSYNQHAESFQYNPSDQPNYQSDQQYQSQSEQQYYGQQLEDQSYVQSEERHENHLDRVNEPQQQGSVDFVHSEYSRTDYTYTGYSQADTHDGDETLFGETLIDSVNSTTVLAAHPNHMSAPDDLQMHLSPVRHHHQSAQGHTESPHGGAYLSPSEGSYGSYGSKDSPLGYSMNSINSLGDVSDVQPHELDASADDTHAEADASEELGISSLKSRTNEPTEEHMYISDDEERVETRPHTGEANSAYDALNMSDLSHSPMALSTHSPALDGAYPQNTNNISMDGTSRELFGDSVSLDGVADGDFPAGGAYGLVKKLKLSPRPAN